MKKILLLIATITFLTNCDSDRCDEGYKPYDSNGHEICIPEYLNGKDHNFEIGNIYMHEIHGAITLKDGVWRDEFDQIIFIK